MLFRADFVRQKHVPGSIETNHGSLSKIIGNCWRQLPLDEKRIWEIKAKQEKANHKAQFPDYRFRPVHNKNKNKDKSSSTPTTNTTTHSLTNNLAGTMQEEEERRCEQVAQLLLGGMKGDELARAVRDLDRVREEEVSNSNPDKPSHTNNAFEESPSLAMPIPMSSFHNPFSSGGLGYSNSNSGLALPPSAYRRRPSSVPLPLHNPSSDFLSPFGGPGYAPPVHFDMSGIALPSVPYISQSRPVSPINNISRQNQQRVVLGHRRASSAQPVYRRSWSYNNNAANFGNNPFSQADFSVFDWTGVVGGGGRDDESPLPDVDPELFNGFSFEGGVDHPSLPISSEISSSSASSCSASSSPWLDGPTHTRSHSQLAIAPHDLPPLDITASDMTWHQHHQHQHHQPAQAQALLSAVSSSSSSSTFPSPSLSASIPIHDCEKRDPNMITPTNGMFELGLGLGIDFIGMEGGGAGGGEGGGVVDYTYGYNEMGFVGDLGMGYGHGGGMGVTEMDTMWNQQHQQA
jgi:hypothetical protein